MAQMNGYRQRLEYEGTWAELRQVNGELAEVDQLIAELQGQRTVILEHKAHIKAQFIANARARRRR